MYTEEEYEKNEPVNENNIYDYGNHCDEPELETSNNQNTSNKNKQFIIIIILAIIFVILIFLLIKSCDKNPNNNGNNQVMVELSKESLELKVGESYKIEYTILNSKDKIDITWHSSDETIANVTNDGTITGIKKGKTTIIASYFLDNVPYQETCVVNVIENDGVDVNDNIKPVLNYELKNGKNNEWTNKNVTINIEATDNSGFVEVKYAFDCTKDCNYATVKNNTLTVSKEGTTIVTIVASDRNNNYVQKTLTIKIDKKTPVCLLSVNEDGVISSKYTDNNGSGINYYGFSSSYSGTTTNTKKLSSAGTYTYYVKDKAGNANTCSLAVKTKIQYKYQDCISCKRCSAAGCDNGIWQSAGKTSYTASCNTTFPKVVGDNKYISCTVSSENSNGTCNFLCSYSKWKCLKDNSSCEKCGGCDSWGNESGWTDNISASSSRKITNTRTLYYS